MKNKGLFTAAVLAAILKLSSLCLAQDAIVPDSLNEPSNSTAAFNALLRDFDLNEETQNGYAITEAEYEQLQLAWQGLSRPERNQFLYGAAGEFWTNTFVIVLFHDLNNGKNWEAHFNNVTNYRVRPRGLSLTLSRFDRPLSLKTARKMLVDLLHKDSSLFNNGQLQIDDEIKTQARQRAGDKAQQRLEKWEQLINDYQNRPEMEKLEAVNTFFNQQIMPRDDELTEIKCDYWQSPIETLVRGIGDCDDFAMAKYVSLRLLGIPPEQLRVAVVEHPLIGGHAMLLFFPPNEKDPWVLDNLTFEYSGLTDNHILRLSERMIRHRIKPLWGINENCLTEFRGGLNEKVTSTDPRHSSHKFGTALMNSQRLLPQTRG